MNKNIRKLSLLLLVVFCAMTLSKTIATHASVGTVTGYEKITWGISTGRYYVNGIHAFCSEYNKTWPTVGTQITSILPCTNEIIRKALYYGYHGPKNTLGTDERAHVLTAIAISDANIGVAATDVKQKYHEFYWDIVNNPSKYPVPPNQFKAFLAKPSSNQMQTLAFYEVEKNGYIIAQKESKDLKITNGNPCYSLQGAEYGVYQDATCSESSKVGKLTINEAGQSNRLELAPGRYYARETVAPKGYQLNEEVVGFTVSSEQTTRLTFQNAPICYKPDIILQKIDAQTEAPIPQRNASLQGAQFLVKFYTGLWDEGVDPGELERTPTHSWIFETDEEGKILWSSEYQVEGDALYESIPLGTLTIQETKASKGYDINKETFILRLTETGMEQAPIVKEEYIEPIPQHIELPNTGSSKTLWVVSLGGVLCISYVYLSNQKRRKQL